MYSFCMVWFGLVKLGLVEFSFGCEFGLVEFRFLHVFRSTMDEKRIKNGVEYRVAAQLEIKNGKRCENKFYLSRSVT